jgi:hypothetical protein
MTTCKLFHDALMKAVIVEEEVVVSCCKKCVRIFSQNKKGSIRNLKVQIFSSPKLELNYNQACYQRLCWRRNRSLAGAEDVVLQINQGILLSGRCSECVVISPAYSGRHTLARSPRCRSVLHTCIVTVGATRVENFDISLWADVGCCAGWEC